MAAAAAVAAAGACGATRGDSMRGRLASPARPKELRWLLLVLALAGVDGRASGALLEGGLDGSRRKPSSTDAKPPVLDEVMRDSSISTRTRSAEDMREFEPLAECALVLGAAGSESSYQVSRLQPLFRAVL